MITLITGTPGAGKTLYCVDKLLRELVGSVVKSTDSEGNPVEIPRRILSNINGLLLDHEKIDGKAGGGLADWHLWAKPGDVIVYDEVQKEWPIRPNGSKVPDCIQGLETHRHMGVDFIVITQGPLLVDQNMRALVGRHLHVRRFGGSKSAVVYEWDHCSRQLLYKNAMNKRPYLYSKDVFQLYKSAELHTKPKTTIPVVAFLTLLAMGATAYLVPNVMSRIAGKVDAQKIAADKSKGSPGPVATPVAAGQSAIPVGPPRPVEVSEHLPVPDIRPPLASVGGAKTSPPPAPPVPIESVEYAGVLRSDMRSIYVLRAGDRTYTSDALQQLGYEVSTDDGCVLRISFHGADKTVVCSGGAAPPPVRVTPSGRDVDRAYLQLAKGRDKTHAPAVWPASSTPALRANRL